MIIKAFVFLLLLYSVAAGQNDADVALDIGQNSVQQSCTKEDLLHAQGKSPCMVKLKSSQALVEEMAKQFGAYYNQLALHQNITASLKKRLQKNHTDYNNQMLDLLKEYKTDIEQLQNNYSSLKRKQLCKTFLPRIEKRHRSLETLGKSIKAEVANARHQSLGDANAPTTWYGKSWKWVENAWNTIERPLFATIGIGIFCQFVYKIGKGIYTWGRSAFVWGRNALSLASQRADIAELASTTEELIGDSEMGADTQRLLSDLADVVEPDVELAEAADEAVVSEAISVMEASEASEAAMQAIGTPEAATLLNIARATELARVTEAGQSIEATQAAEIAQAVQIARVAEAAEGVGEAAVEGAVEGAAEATAEGAAEGAAEVAAEGAEVTAESVLTGVGEAIAVEGAEATAAVAAAEGTAAVVAGTVAAEGTAAVVAGTAAEGAAVAVAGTAAAVPVAIAAVGVIAVGAIATGIAYVIDPEGTKRFYRNLWNSIRHLFGYY